MVQYAAEPGGLVPRHELILYRYYWTGTWKSSTEEHCRRVCLVAVRYETIRRRRKEGWLENTLSQNRSQSSRERTSLNIVSSRGHA